MTDRASSNQRKINKGQQAQALRDNPLLTEVFTALKAGYFDKLTKVKKGERYEEELKDIHESMQNLIRMEAYIDRCIGDAKVVVNEKQQPDVL
jgi:hypothetical protein